MGEGRPLVEVGIGPAGVDLLLQGGSGWIDMPLVSGFSLALDQGDISTFWVAFRTCIG